MRNDWIQGLGSWRCSYNWLRLLFHILLCFALWLFAFSVSFCFSKLWGWLKLFQNRVGGVSEAVCDWPWFLSVPPDVGNLLSPCIDCSGPNCVSSPSLRGTDYCCLCWVIDAKMHSLSWLSLSAGLQLLGRDTAGNRRFSCPALNQLLETWQVCCELHLQPLECFYFSLRFSESAGVWQKIAKSSCAVCFEIL